MIQPRQHKWVQSAANFFFFFHFQKELKEEERVAGVVATIDEETAVVPQGAYVKGPLGDVTVNRSFQGEQQATSS